MTTPHLEYQIWKMLMVDCMLWQSLFERLGLEYTPEMLALKELMEEQRAEIFALLEGEIK